jgi:diaminopimelate epimerase
MGLRFSKMHGAGNDFVVVDCREHPLGLDATQMRRLADRHFGVGFDQLLTIERARDPACAFAYAIRNADGSPSGQCGNGLRCVARWLERAGLIGVGATQLQSPSGTVAVEVLADGRVGADMGVPRFAPADIPLRADAQADRYAIDVLGRKVDIGAVSMGNPHAVIEVDDIANAPVAVLGPQIEHGDAFPQGCNVGFAQVLARDAIRLRVWERGVGETLACGSGACAAVAVLRRRGRVDADVRVHLPGGELDIHWNGDGEPLRMTGPAAFVFEGELDA